jgi:hypothetical protein
MKKAWGTTVAALVGLSVVLGAGCAKKPVNPQVAQQAVMDKMKAEAAAAAAKRDVWMTQGVYVSGKTEWQDKIIQAEEKTEALNNYQLGLYAEGLGSSLELDGEVNQANSHLHFVRNHQPLPTEFFLVGDRYYSVEGETVLDNGPNSRGAGEKSFLPLLQDIRSAIRQAARGEIKDVGMSQFQTQPVHKYDLKIGLPGTTPPELLTVTVEIDETRGVLLHAVLGNGTGSESSAKRFLKQYRELAYTKLGTVPAVGLPQGVTVTPYVEDINNQKMGMP